MRRWTNEEVEYLKNNYETMSYEDIGKHIDRSPSMIRAKCFDLRLIKKDRWTDDEIKYLKEHYEDMSTGDIAQSLGRSHDAVHVKAKKLGLKKYPYNCDYNFFSEIDTEEKAYWLGFIYADGYITINRKTNSGVVGIDLQYGDIGHLKKFNKSIQGNYKITKRERPCTLSTRDKEKLNELCSIRIYSIKMVEDLIKHGVNENKSYNIEFPDLDEPLVRHFIRGFFDGDGCVRTRTRKTKNGIVEYPVCDFTCHEKDFLDSLRSYLYKQGICSYIYPSRSCSRLYVHANDHAISLLKLMYKDSTIYLDRKYERYKTIIGNAEQECLAV